MSDGGNARYGTRCLGRMRFFFFFFGVALLDLLTLLSAKDSTLQFKDDPLSGSVINEGDTVDNEMAYDSDGSRSIFPQWARLFVHINIGVMRHGLSDAK